MTDRPAVSVLIVSYNTRDMTLACIASVIAETRDTAHEIIVVDNASSDGSADEIARRFASVKLIRSPLNLGFGKANNLAADAAESDLILLLNPDTLIQDNAIGKLVQFTKLRPKAGIWGGRTVFADGSLNPTSCWRFMSVWSLFCSAVGLSRVFRNSDIFDREGYGGWQHDTVREVDFVTGCFLLIRRDLWRELGGFDERFFMYAEETDLCYRARARGAEPVVTPEATIVHYGGASEPVKAAKFQRLFAGKMTFVEIHWPAPWRKLARLMFYLHVLVRLAAVTGLSLVYGTQQHAEAAADWRDIWKSRNKWKHGYMTAPPDALLTKS